MGRAGAWWGEIVLEQKIKNKKDKMALFVSIICLDLVKSITQSRFGDTK